jgi:Extensin-like protein C-terminus
LGLLSLGGCGFMERAQRAAWRTEAENYCLAKGYVKASQYIEPLPEISGPGICGMTHPFKVYALKDGTIPLSKPVVLDCPMIPTLEAWVDQWVQPSALSRLGAPVAELEVFGAYSCRTVDNLANTKLSEHAYGNAIDVSGFKLADGREIPIVSAWKTTDTQESAFVHEAQAGACRDFTTVLAPGSDSFHYNHFHLDLANHGSTNTGRRTYCRPTPSPDLLPPPGKPDGLPPAPEIDEPMDVARARPAPPAPQFAEAPIDLHGFSAAAPQGVETSQPPSYAPVLPSEDVDNMPTSSIVPHDD